MKKILSYILLVAMLINLLVPALSVSAENGNFSVNISNTEFMQGSSSPSVSAVSLENNTAVNYLNAVVYFKTAEIDTSSVTVDFTGTIFSSDESYVSGLRAGTHRNVKPLLEELGLVPADYKVYEVELMVVEGNVIESGHLFTVNLMPTDINAVGAVGEYGVIVSEAYDLEGNELVLDLMHSAATLTVTADPYLGVYDHFSVFAAGPDEIEPGTKTVDVQLRVDGNTGVWSMRPILAYTAGWEIVGISNGNVFSDAAFGGASPSKNYQANLLITGEYQYPFSEGYNAYNIDAVGNWGAVAFFDPPDPSVSGNVYGNGTLLNITFKVPESAVAGDKLTIELCTVPGDTILANNDNENPVITLDDPQFYGKEIVISGDGTCTHPTSTSVTTPAQVGVEGKVEVICDSCGEILETVIIPALPSIDGLSVNVDSVSFKQGSTQPAVAHVTADSNSSIYASYVTAIVYFDPAAIDEETIGISFDNTVFSVENSIFGSVILGTNRKVKTNLETAGLTAADYKCIIVETAVDSDDIEVKGNLFDILLSPVNGASVGDVCKYGVILQEVYDGNGEDITFSTNASAATLTVAAADHLNTYDHFAIYTVGETVISPKTETVEIQLRVDNNPGMWSTRVFFAYNPEWEIISAENGTVFSSDAFSVDTNSHFNVLMTEEGKYPFATAFEQCGINAVGKNAGAIFFTPADAGVAGNAYTNGTLLTLTFKAKTPEALALDNVLNIELATISGDTIVASGNDVEVIADPALYGMSVTVYCDHSSTYDDMFSPGCETEGRIWSVCNVCETVIIDEILPATGHNWIKGEVVAPTYDTEGYTVYTCSSCDKTKHDDIVPPGLYDHFAIYVTSDEVLSADTNTVDIQLKVENNPGMWSTRVFLAYDPEWDIQSVENGNVFPHDAFSDNNYSINTFITDEYKYPYSDAFEEWGINALGKKAAVFLFDPGDPSVNGNTFENGVLLTLTFKAPEGAVNGSTLDVQMATVSGDTIVATENGPVEIDPAPVLYGEAFTFGDGCSHNDTFVRTTDAGCDTDGLAETVCSVCGTIVESIVLPATGHDYIITLVDATCTDSGYEITTCSKCDFTETEILPALGHNWGEPTEGEPTCTEPFVQITKCLACGLEETNIIPPYNHDQRTVTANVPAFCTAPGYTVFDCMRCGLKGITEIDKEALGHEFVVGEIISPTCNSDGYTIYFCTRCDVSENRDIVPADETMHNWTVKDVIPPACGEDGYTVYFCEICGCEEYRDFVSASEHKWIITSITPPTETEKGIVESYCMKCQNSSVHEYGTLGATDPYLNMFDKFTVFAAGNTTVDYNSCTVEVQLRIDNNPGIWSTRVFMAYDPDWEILSVTNGNVFESDAFSDSNYRVNVLMNENIYPFTDAFDECGIDAEGMNGAVLFFDPDDPSVNGNVYGNGILATVVFKIPDTAADGDKLTLMLATMVGDTIVSDDAKVVALENPALAGLQITLNKTNNNVGTGDITGDGRVDLADYNFIRRCLLDAVRYLTEERLLAADINGDGRLDNIDLNLVRRELIS